MSFSFLGLESPPDTPLFLAPQAGVSESPFRRLCRSFGADVVATEFVSATGLLRGSERTADFLRFDEDERPIGIQIFGAEPEVMGEAAGQVAEAYRPTYVDINFGCPVKKVVKRNGGSGCLRDLELVGDIVRAVVEGTTLPVTTKIRSGFDEAGRDPVRIAEVCRDAGSRMICLHPRTREEMYSGTARWDEIRAVKQAMDIPVVGNGDVRAGDDAARMRDETGCDGIMIARGSHGTPWLFKQARAALEGERVPDDPLPAERFAICLRHARNAVDFEPDPDRAVIEFRKHLGWYTKGLPGGRKLRSELHQVTSLEEIHERLTDYVEESRLEPAAV